MLISVPKRKRSLSHSPRKDKNNNDSSRMQKPQMISPKKKRPQSHNPQKDNDEWSQMQKSSMVSSKSSNMLNILPTSSGNILNIPSTEKVARLTRNHSTLNIFQKRRHTSADTALLALIKEKINKHIGENSKIKQILQNLKFDFKKEDVDQYTYSCYKVYINKENKIHLLILKVDKNTVKLAMTQYGFVIKSKIWDNFYNTISKYELPQHLAQIKRAYTIQQKEEYKI